MAGSCAKKKALYWGWDPCLFFLSSCDATSGTSHCLTMIPIIKVELQSKLLSIKFCQSLVKVASYKPLS